MEIRELTFDDLPAVSKIHIFAFPESGLTKFGLEVVRRYYRWQLLGPHDSTCIGVFDKNTLLGFCFAGVFHGAEPGFLKKNLFYLIATLVLHPWLIVNELIISRVIYSTNVLIYFLQNLFKKKTSRNELNISSTNTKGKFGILSIAVSPSHQCKGIGQMMIDEVAKIAVLQGFVSIRLSVHKNNISAINFYEKNGWRKTLVNNGEWQGIMVKNL